MRNNLSNIARAGSAYPSIAHILLILIIGGIGVQTFTSCSSGGDDDPPPGGGGGAVETLAIKNITGDSFTAVETEYWCREDGTLEEQIYEYPTSYAINGSTLSFGGAQFSGNSPSLTGTWNASDLQRITFNGRGSISYSGISKAVFTSNTLALTQCAGEPGYERERNGIIFKVIDCGTAEYTKGNETIKLNFSGRTYTYTYNDKICSTSEPSQAQYTDACTQAYNKAKADGYEGNGYLVSDYSYEILKKDIRDCIKDFPEWSLNLL